ncbi:DUF421 domain-containing protein [Deinococcus yavapaiensis]|uniref:Uncharacterized protein DUF421 n=1 Tax=Deinococcus yavapaiensis KR-236 TaxID=694435 RepID=A0A318S7V6_9DEIO|nr:YetF domain-containing protein [Deinococcus yavapaiensis]PYE54947.1 uncharacterized protein DUF421 [Deinococcus yavapaiensis KR-236]
MNWSQVFGPDVPLSETVVRGTVMYLVLFALLRFLQQRQASSLSVTDLLVVVLIADASGGAMGGAANSVWNGAALVGTIVFWSWCLNWLAFRYKFFDRLIHPPALPLVKDGRIDRRNMRRELITMEELMTQVRRQGLERIEDVAAAYMEGDGNISVIPKSGLRG